MGLKADVLRALLVSVEDDLAGVESMLAMARDEATSSESRSEGKYDTRATKASYLARGQAERVAALRRDRVWLQTRMRADRDSELALIRVTDGTRQRWFLVSPVCGGRSVRIADATVVVVTPGSPMGEELDGAECGDDVTVKVAGMEHVWAVDAVH